VSRLLLLCLLLLASGCASALSSAQGPPPDVPDPARARVTARDGFRVWLDRGCLSGADLDGLIYELSTTKEWLLKRLGEGRATGDFRPASQARGFSPDPHVPVPEWIDVVVLKDGGRCHADSDGLTLLARHVPRRDASHELVHFLSGSSWRPIDEGLAVYLTEEKWGPARGFPVKTRARVFLDLDLNEERLEPPALAGGMSRLDYDTAGAFVRWLIEAYGWKRFWTLYHGPSRAYYAAYGVGEVELWSRFWRYIGSLDLADSTAYRAYRAIVRTRR
jgi:hypothetical protein